MSRWRLLQATSYCLIILSFIASSSLGSSTDEVHGEIDRRLALLKEVALRSADGSATRDCSNRNFIFMHERPYGKMMALYILIVDLYSSTISSP
jgi:hypothetical protein